MIKTATTNQLSIEHPVVCAPMAGVAGARLATAVSAAGGLGLIGGGYGEGDWLANELRETDCAHIGVGFITWRLAKRPELLEIALSHQPKAIFLSFGDISAFAPVVKAANCHLIAQVQSVADARRAIELGADTIVAQGTEAGGHGAARATLPLVPAVVDIAGDVPVLAAGGIGDGRGLAAALMLGASGVVMGTRFYCVEESMASAASKRKVMNTSGDETIRTSVYDILREYDWPRPYNLRTLRNTMTNEFGGDLAGLRDDKSQQISRFKQAITEDNVEIAPVIAGEAVDLVNDASTAAEVVQRIVREAEVALGQTGDLVVG